METYLGPLGQLKERMVHLNRDKPRFPASELPNVDGINDRSPEQLQGERPVRETELSLNDDRI